MMTLARYMLSLARSLAVATSYHVLNASRERACCMDDRTQLAVLMYSATAAQRPIATRTLRVLQP